MRITDSHCVGARPTWNQTLQPLPSITYVALGMIILLLVCVRNTWDNIYKVIYHNGKYLPIHDIVEKRMGFGATTKFTKLYHGVSG